MSYVTFDPYIPLALWFPLAMTAAVLLVVYGIACRERLQQRRRWTVLLLMTTAVAFPLAVLLNPTWVEQIPPPGGKPRLTILVDRSVSMTVADVADAPSRLAAATQYAGEMASALQDRFDVRTFAFADTCVPRDIEDLRNARPEGEITDVATAIENALDDVPQGQALLLVSDGIHNAAGGAERVLRNVEKARAMAAPIYTRTFGGASGVRDIEVTLASPQDLAFVGQTVPVRVRLRQRGILSDRLTLRLHHDGKTLEQRQVSLVADGTTEAVFQVVQKKSGLYRYEVRAEPLESEITAANNSAVLVLRVVDEPVRVLLLEGKPYWDTKFLIRTLVADESIELTSIVKMTEDRFLQRRIRRLRSPVTERKVDHDAGTDATASTTSNPSAGKSSRSSGTDASSAEGAAGESWTVQSDAAAILREPSSLKDYQIVVLGRESEIYLDDQAVTNIRKWLVDGDGSLVCFRGPPASKLSQRLGQLMPLRWSPSQESRFRVQLTQAGQQMQWLPFAADAGGSLADLPSLSSAAQPLRPSPLAVVLATSVDTQGQTRPVITYQRVGNGRVVVVEGAGMWRWAFLAAQYKQHDELYGVLWRSLVRWLVANAGLLPSQRLALRTDQVTFSTYEPATATLLIRKSELAATVPQVELISDAGKTWAIVTPTPSGDTAGHFRVVFGKLPQGRYTARVVNWDASDPSGTTVFDVRGDLRERLEVAARSDLMAAIARDSGGGVLDDADPAQLVRDFEQYRKATLPQRVVHSTAWDRWWVLLGVVAVWATTWTIRRRSGLT